MNTTKEIISIDVRRQHDENPDLSWLGCPDSYMGLPTDEVARYMAQDRERIAAYERGEWSMLGIVAAARVSINGVVQELLSGGLWGIESDSGDDYLREIGDNELDALKAILLECGFTPKEVDAA